jgi:hypothetical protein
MGMCHMAIWQLTLRTGSFFPSVLHPSSTMNSPGEFIVLVCSERIWARITSFGPSGLA